MTSETDALEAVLSRVTALPREKLALIDSLGRFAAQELFASRPLPAFDNSAMDGYAMQASSGAIGARLRVIGEQPAGAERGLSIGPGEAIRIFTGAPLPASADAVVMQEDVIRDGETIALQCAVAKGEFVRRKGIDLAAGQKILEPGQRLAAQVLGLLASQGIAEIEVGAAPRVAIVATGDELARPGGNPQPGQIFESNSVMLQALALGAGAKIELIEHSRDDLSALTETLRRGAQADALIVCGGVSVGDRDLVKPALRELGAQLDLWRVALKPGKPFLFGRLDRCHIFGLPGNPVSAFVTFLKFVRPALRKMMGAGEQDLGLNEIPAQLAGEVNNDGDRPHYLRGEIRDGIFRSLGRQESHALFGLSRANALLRLEPGETLAHGAAVRVQTWE